MEIDLSRHSLPIFEALASKVRIAIIHLLAEKSMNIKELAEALGLSSAIMTMHVKKLEKAGIIRTEMIPGKGGVQKRCVLYVDKIEVLFPSITKKVLEYHETEVSVGHFTDFSAEPTCGLATQEAIIGEFDDPRYFLAAERINAKILWLGKGFLEYRIPNFLLASQEPKSLEISLEISSEAPFTNSNWPSDISFYLNNHHLGVWTSPGDFGDRAGKFTPSWWPSVVNQYGLLKHLRITENGTFIDGKKLSDTSIDSIGIRDPQFSLRIAVEGDSENVGGLTIFGSGFGNYNQDILFRLYYE